MTHQTALHQYRSTHVETGSVEKLIVLLYEGAIRFCDEAAAAIGRDDIPARAAALNRASRIVQELRHSLDHEVGGDLAANLDALYDFVEHRLTSANLDHHTAPLDDATRILGILLEGWRKIAAGEVPVVATEEASTQPAPPALSLSV